MIKMPRFWDFLEAIFTTMIIAALYASFVVLRQSVEDMQKNSCGEALWKTLSVITGLKMLNFTPRKSSKQ